MVYHCKVEVNNITLNRNLQKTCVSLDTHLFCLCRFLLHVVTEQSMVLAAFLLNKLVSMQSCSAHLELVLHGNWAALCIIILYVTRQVSQSGPGCSKGG